ncbi:uncharacterized protein LOC110893150 [Helianthus annuus]|uniref:uncharacterized protein LOC110893150 n=1 Tax=Helianthus annuus TaxID=4232 RepID=UPI001652C33D|nr:uncharacterized protein LOC110893150 [Helianthus annuus]
MKKQTLISSLCKRKYQENDDLGATPSSNIIDDKQENEDIGPNSKNDIDMQENEDIRPTPSPIITLASSPSTRNKIDLNDLPSDPSDRPPITSYHLNQIYDIRRAYLVKKAFQPRGHHFKWTNYSSGRRRFNVKWFDKYHWLEYSTKQEKAYCLYCYLFNESVGNKGGRETFVSEGFCNWSKPGALKEHVGLVNSIHNKAAQKCENLLNQKRSYDANEKRRNKERRIGNQYRLMGVNNPDIGKYTLGKAKKNNKLTAPSIQKEIADCYAKEVTKMICEEIKDDVFGLLVDESSDVSLKEQMAVVVRYVDKVGVLKESLIGVAHVRNTYSLTLKEAIVSLLADNHLSINQGSRL